MRYLFERLADPQPSEGPPSLETLQLGVLRQLQCIVATRPWLMAETEAEDEHLLNFGQTAVPDLAVGNAQQIHAYGVRLKQLIRRYEPRLEEVEVALAPCADPCAPLKVTISGVLRDSDDGTLGLRLESAPRQE